MKLALAALLIFAAAAPAVEAKPSRYNRYQRGYVREEKCYRNEYREEYIPGTSRNRGYVKTWRENVEVPCERPRFMPQTSPNSFPRYEEQYPDMGRYDDNSCVEGSILGGIAGGALGGVLSTQENWIWSIPLGVVGGAMTGCQVDGG